MSGLSVLILAILLLALTLTDLSPSADVRSRPGEAPPLKELLTLWYRRPAAQWVEALPIGNGRLGAMVFGGVTEDRLQFNEDTLWTGKPHEYHHEGAVKFLPVIRQLLWDGKQREAEALAMQEFMSVPLRQMAYQPFGDLRLHFPGHNSPTDYRRELDIDSAMATTHYRIGDVNYERRYFASHPLQVIVVRLTASRRGSLTFTAKLDSPHENWRMGAIGNDQLALIGQVQEDGLKFEARVRVAADGGKCHVTDDAISVENADSVTLLLAAATSFRNFRDISADPAQRCEQSLKRATSMSYDALLKSHVDDYQRLFRRVAIDLGRTSRGRDSAPTVVPTDERIKSAELSGDPELAALFFQFGRYLLISSSRPGDQPANLQGIWNDQLKPPWDSKWTVNINTQMNYWPAEVTNLSECHEPLFDLIDEVVITGRNTAQAHYGFRGWVLHHNTDLWRGTAPINNSNHGIWPTGGAWLVLCHS